MMCRRLEAYDTRSHEQVHKFDGNIVEGLQQTYNHDAFLAKMIANYCLIYVITIAKF